MSEDYWHVKVGTIDFMRQLQFLPLRTQRNVGYATYMYATR